MTKLNSDNLNVRVNENGEIVVEPSYIEFLRSQGYTIEELIEAHSVPSESRDMAHIVVKVKTYAYPRNHPKLDYAVHERVITACSCWSWRTNSNDVREGEKPGGSGCKHVRTVFKAEKAKQDDQQETLE